MLINTKRISVYFPSSRVVYQQYKFETAPDDYTGASSGVGSASSRIVVCSRETLHSDTAPCQDKICQPFLGCTPGNNVKGRPREFYSTSPFAREFQVSSFSMRALLSRENELSSPIIHHCRDRNFPRLTIQTAP